MKTNLFEGFNNLGTSLKILNLERLGKTPNKMEEFNWLRIGRKEPN